MWRIFLLVVSVLWGNYVIADTGARCDCSTKLGSCVAAVKIQGNQILTSSNSQQCSMVVFYADGQPNITIVTDGISAEEWLGPSKNPQLSIDSCKVCRDNQISGSPTQSSPVAGGKASAGNDNQFPFEGLWEGAANNAVRSNRAEYYFHHDGQNITGWYRQNGAAKDPITNLQWNGNTINFKVNYSGGSYKATLQKTGNNELTGKWRNWFLSGDISLTRRQ